MNSGLSGVRIVVTRSAGGAAERWCRELGRRGAAAARLPLLEVVPPDDPAPLTDAARRLGEYDWIVFTSANAVEAVARAAAQRWPARLRLGALGPRTAEALRLAGHAPDLMPSQHRATALAEGLLPHLREGSRILLPQAADAAPVLAERLRTAGHEVDRVSAYAKRMPSAAPRRAVELFADASLGWVTFASGSAARHFVQALGWSWTRRKSELMAASIGPTTSAALRELGVEPACEAPSPGIGPLADAIERALATG